MNGTTNMVSLVGRVGSIDVIGKLMEFSLATDDGKKEQLVTNWHTIHVRGEAASQALVKVLEKGMSVSVLGILEYNKFRDRDGREKKKAIVVSRTVEIIKWNSSRDERG